VTEHDHYEQDVDETGFVIDDALSVIVLVQGLPSDSVAAKELQAAVALKREARSRLARLVADARDEETSWAEIGHILGTGRLFAACRYGPFVRRRRTPLALN
jgi:hypothetical protein